MQFSREKELDKQMVVDCRKMMELSAPARLCESESICRNVRENNRNNHHHIGYDRSPLYLGTWWEGGGGQQEYIGRSINFCRSGSNHNDFKLFGGQADLTATTAADSAADGLCRCRLHRCVPVPPLSAGKVLVLPFVLYFVPSSSRNCTLL